MTFRLVGGIGVRHRPRYIVELGDPKTDCNICGPLRKSRGKRTRTIRSNDRYKDGRVDRSINRSRRFEKDTRRAQIELEIRIQDRQQRARLEYQQQQQQQSISSTSSVDAYQWAGSWTLRVTINKARLVSSRSQSCLRKEIYIVRALRDLPIYK